MLKRINKYITQTEQMFGSSLIGILFAIIVVGIFSRYVLDRPISFIEEISNFLFIYVSFLAIAYAFARSKHISIDILVRKLSHKLNIYFSLFIHVLLEVLFIILIIPLFRAMSGFELSSVLRIPEKYIYLILPLTFVLIILHNLQIIITLCSEIYSFKGKNEHMRESV